LLPLIDFDRISSFPKPFVGYSDLTPLGLNLWRRAGVPFIHGAHVGVEFSRAAQCPDARNSAMALMAYLEGEKPEPFHASVMRSGSEGSGWLLAGNLTMLCSMLGTPWDISWDGAILVVEEVGEAAYRIYRSFTQLKLAGKLQQLRGVVFGRLSGLGQSVEYAALIERLTNDVLSDFSYPVLYDVSVGHNGLNLPVPVGVNALVAGNKLIVDQRCLQPNERG
jgi:muramoyltetrapeptide carboxypeptidase